MTKYFFQWEHSVVISKIFPHDFLVKIPSKYFSTEELNYKLISRKFLEVGVNFRHYTQMNSFLWTPTQHTYNPDKFWRFLCIFAEFLNFPSITLSWRKTITKILGKKMKLFHSKWRLCFMNPKLWKIDLKDLKVIPCKFNVFKLDYCITLKGL